MAEFEEVHLQSLSKLDDDTLEALLGSQVQAEAQAKAIEDEVAGRGARGAGADSDFPEDMICTSVPFTTAINPKFLNVVGQGFFNKINPQAYKLLCTPFGGEGSDKTMQELVKLLDEDLEKNVAKAAGMLAPVLTTSFGVAPAVAVLVSTLILRRVSKGVSKFTCDAWQKTLPSSESSETSSNSEGTASNSSG